MITGAVTWGGMITGAVDGSALTEEEAGEVTSEDIITDLVGVDLMDEDIITDLVGVDLMDLMGLGVVLTGIILAGTKLSLYSLAHA